MKKLLAGIMTLSLSVTSQAAWTLIDNFDDYDNSSSTLLSDGITYKGPPVRDDVWVGVPGTTDRSHIYDDSALGGQTLATYGGSWNGAETDLANNYASDFSLADGNTATYFFQFKVDGTSYDCMFGLTEDTSSVDENDAWLDYAVMPYIAGGQLKVYGNNIGDSAITPISTGLWYNVWLVVDNGAKQFDMYWSTGTTNSTLGASNVEFGRVTNPVDLAAFAFSQNLSSTVHIDNLYMTSGVDTSFPSTDIVIVPSSPPPPAEVSTVGGALAGVTNETVYLMCYHEGYYPAGGNSGVFLSWSLDGYNFKPLNDGHPVFVPPEFPADDYDNGSSYPNVVRDPSIVYADGLFHLVYTSDLFSRSFGYASSPDLVHWSNVKLVQIWANTSDTVGVTWAPEVFYDVDAGEYTVVFSSDVAGGTRHMYYTQTTDFENFSDPAEFYYNPSGSWEQIDGFVAKVGTGQYVMAYKDSAQIWMLDGTTPTGPWTNLRQVSTGGSAKEGPAMIKIDGTWHLYYDNYNYGDAVYGMMISTDNTASWTDVSGLTDLPAKADVPDYGYDGGPPHHGTVIAVPLSTLGAFVEPYQDSVTNLSSLVYRWSFNNAAGSAADGTIVTDSISGAEAVVSGSGASFTGTGLELPGTSDGTGNSAYIDLPNGIVSSFSNLTVEIWASPLASKNWQRLFSFGRTAANGDGGGEWTGPASGSTSALNAMYWTLNVDNDMNKQNCVMCDYNDANKEAISGTGMNTLAGTRYHYVFTFEAGVGYFGAPGGRMTFYRDGYQIGWRDVPFQPKDLDDVNNWLGRSQWSSDSNSNVEYDEVRIYSDALSWYDIYGHYVAGPDVVVNTSPQIDIAVNGAEATLTWPGNTVGFLQQTDVLDDPTVWETVTNDMVNTTNGLQVTVPASTQNALFILKR